MFESVPFIFKILTRFSNLNLAKPFSSVFSSAFSVNAWIIVFWPSGSIAMTARIRDAYYKIYFIHTLFNLSRTWCVTASGIWCESDRQRTLIVRKSVSILLYPKPTLPILQIDCTKFFIFFSI